MLSKETITLKIYKETHNQLVEMKRHVSMTKFLDAVIKQVDVTFDKYGEPIVNLRKDL